MTVLSLIASFAALFLVVFVVSYLLQAFSIYYILKNMSYQNPFFAFIPFLNIYALSSIVPYYTDDKVYVTAEIGIKKELFRFWWLIAILLAMIPAVGWILSLIVRILCYTRIIQYVYAVFDKRREEEEIVLAVISSIFPIIFFIKCLIYMFSKTRP